MSRSGWFEEESLTTVLAFDDEDESGDEDEGLGDWEDDEDDFDEDDWDDDDDDDDDDDEDWDEWDDDDDDDDDVYGRKRTNRSDWN